MVKKGITDKSRIPKATNVDAQRTTRATNEVSRTPTKRGASSGTIARGLLVKYPSGFRNGFNNIPHYPSEIKKLADEFLKWVYDSDTTDLREFPISKSLNPYKFKRIKDEYFQEAYLIACLIASARVDKKWKNGEIDRVYASQKLTMYDEDYKNMMMERYKQIAAGSSLTAITVVDPNNYNCPEIPAKSGEASERSGEKK